MIDRKLRERGWAAVLTALALSTYACAATINGTIPPPVANAPSGFRAGAGISDLTPIPGIPMAGYSVIGKIARGAWVRLHARALYLEDAAGDALVLVACDLDMIPTGLADRVAELLHTTTAVDHLGREQILLSASHTHHGPTGFFTSTMYNSMAGPRGGFDEELFDFLALRIVEAIQKAHASRVSAILQTAPAPGAVGAPDDRLQCVFRNRSREAFEQNPETEVNALRAANPLTLPCPARCPDPEACKSVHTQIDFFKVVEKGTPTNVIGVGVFLAAHATALSTDNELYSADFFGVTSTLLETGTCIGGALKPVVAIFNGAEGDVSPGWEEGKRDRRGVLEIAKDVATRVCNILPSAVSRPSADIAFRWSEIEDLADRPVDDPFDRRLGWEQRTAREPRVGAPGIGGAEDGVTPLHEMGFVEGLRGPGRDDQGAKQPYAVEMMGMRTSVSSLAAMNESPPRQAPLGVYRLGNLALVSLPGEFTTMMGDRIRRHVATNLAVAPDRVVLMGLTGGHVSYVTTSEEYEAQHYEGAQNIYGAATGAVMADGLGVLAQQLDVPGPPPTPIVYSYNPGTRRRWRARDAAGPPYEAHEGLNDVVEDLVSRELNPGFPTFCFRDAVPRLSEIGAGGCQRALPEARIQTGVGVDVAVGGVPQSSEPGLDVVTVLTGVGQDKTTGKDATEWCMVWMVPPGTPAGQYRFVIERIFGSALTSSMFLLGGPPFFEPTDEPLVPDRRSCFLCDSPLDIFSLCPEPQTCQAP